MSEQAGECPHDAHLRRSEGPSLGAAGWGQPEPPAIAKAIAFDKLRLFEVGLIRFRGHQTSVGAGQKPLRGAANES